MKYNLWFLLAVIVALVGAVLTEFAAQDWFIIVAILLGIVIGFVNIRKPESVKFMLAYLVLAAVSGVLAMVPLIGSFISAFFTQLVAIFGPAALIVAAKVIMRTAGSK